MSTKAHRWILIAIPCVALAACSNDPVSLGEDDSLTEGGAARSPDGGTGAIGGGRSDAGDSAGGSGGTGSGQSGSGGAGSGGASAGSGGSAGDPAGGSGGQGGGDPVGCGDATCGADTTCCSQSCGLCTAVDACRAIDCDPPAPSGDCTMDECGEAPTDGPRCDDGSLRGSACVRGDDGSCSWLATDCPPTFSANDGSCGSRGLAPCPDGEFCRHPPSASCGETDLPGKCVAIPDACIRLLAPVCGCDGKTYSNECVAHSQGVSVRSEGECEKPPVRCGGIAGVGCAEREYCDLAQGEGCGVADGTGVCEPRPELCTQQYDPVCGCDDRTYGNACEAAAAGISVAQRGECAGGSDRCGGFAGIACPAGQYCDYARGDGCDIADGQGVCAIRPDACTLQYDPVCGCDNVTYGNACSAANAGASVRSTGECP